jgi:UDP:flavonoid glycosyltransferase YjiC (YdhE family)
MTAKRIVFFTFGSLGDIYPFLALGRELKRRGHCPVIATSPTYRRRVEAEGIAFRPVRPEIDVTDPAMLRKVMDRRTGGRYVICDILLPALRETYEDSAAAAAGADLLVTHPIAYAALLLARKKGIPWASVALAPISLFSIYDPPVAPNIPFAGRLASFGPSFQRRLMNGISYLFEPSWTPFRSLEKELGLAPSPSPLFWTHSPQLALGLFSPLLAKPQRDWPSHAFATGFPFYRHSEGNSTELQRFLDSGDPPVVFTLGSAAVGAAGKFFEHSAHAAHRLGLRAVLLVGSDPRNGPQRDLPPGVIAVPYAPHSAVFPRACVVVHQGGIGTTGEAMRAGRPMLVVPYSHDQPDHAARLTRMGVARTIRPERYNAASAARQIRALLKESSYRDRAAEIAAGIRNETGVATACDLLTSLLRNTASESQTLAPVLSFA